MDNTAAEKARNAKRDSYWGVLYQGWIDARFEIVKSLFALSSAGVGLTATFAFSGSAESHGAVIAGLIVAMVSFGLCSLLCIANYSANSRYFEAIIGDDSDECCKTALLERSVKTVHRATEIAFGMGLSSLVLTVAIRLLIG